MNPQDPQQPRPIIPGSGAPSFGQPMPIGQGGFPAPGSFPSAPQFPGAPQQVVPQYPGAQQPMRPLPVPVQPVPAAAQPAQPQMARPMPLRPQPIPVGANGPGPARPLPVNRPVALTKKGDDQVKVSEREEVEEDIQTEIVRQAPPLLTSMIVHIILVLVLVLIATTKFKKSDSAIELAVEEPEIWAEDLGDQVNQEVSIFDSENPELEKMEYSPVELPPVPDPVATPAVAEAIPDGVTAAATIESAVNGIADGRTPGNKTALLGKFGGTKSTEEAVKLALAWLAAQQNKQTGSWSLKGPYKDGGSYENPVAATALALLAFQGYGITDVEGQYKDNVRLGWQYLLKTQNADGLFTSPAMENHNHTFYAHGPAMIAACEMFAMNPKSTKYKEPAQNAINYAIKTQDPQGGGWRYQPGTDTDTSVSGWILMGMVSGRMAGLDVPEASLQKLSAYLDAAQMEGGSTYRYKVGHPVTAAVSAEGLLMRQYLGWAREDERLVNGVKFILSYPIDMQKADVYYWYYATQVCHHMEGDYWKQWNAVMRQALPEAQTKQGPERGSWDPANDEWGMQGGRLFTTCLCTYMLEVYYRHMPLYDKLYNKSGPVKNAGR